MIRVQRVYEYQKHPASPSYLVERLWPRGVRKETLPVDGWLKDVAPSTELRRWFGHDPARWDEFQRRYRAELDANPAAWQPILEAARRGDVILCYSSRDTEHNSALVLRTYLEGRLSGP